MDEYGNWIYLTPMILGGHRDHPSAAIWKFLGLGHWQAMLRWIHCTPWRAGYGKPTPAELGTIEDEIDDILKAEHAKAASGDETAVDAATLNVAAHRLEGLIHDRRKVLANGHVVAPSG